MAKDKRETEGVLEDWKDCGGEGSTDPEEQNPDAKRWSGGVRHIADGVFPRFSGNRLGSPSNTGSCLPVSPLTPFVRGRRPEPSWEARAQTPRKLAFAATAAAAAAAAALPRASLPPLSAPQIYLRPRPRPDPACNSTPLLHPLLSLPSPSPPGRAQPLAPPRPSARSRAQQVPRTRPPPPRPGQPGRACSPPSRCAPPPESTSYFATQLGPVPVRPAPTPPESAVRSGARSPTPPLPGCRPACPRQPAGTRGPYLSPARGAGLGPGGGAASPRGLGSRKIRTRAGWGLRKASFFILPPPAPAAGPRRSRPRHSAPFTWAEPPGCCRNFALLHTAREAGEAGVGGRWREGGCWDQAAGLPEDTWGRRGRRRKKGAGLHFSGLPPTSPREAGTSLGSRRPRTGHGEERSHLSPASPPLQEGGGGAATPFGVGERSFSLLVDV